MDKLDRLSRKLEIDEKTDKIHSKQAEKYDETVRKLKRLLREARDYSKQSCEDTQTAYHDLEEKAGEILEQAEDRKQVVESRHAAQAQLAKER